MFFHLFNQALLFLHKEINTLLELTTVFRLTSRGVEDINYPFSFCTLLVSWFWELKNNLFWDIALQEKQIISGQANEEVPIVISQENQPSIQISWGILQRPSKLPSTLLLVRHSSGQPKLLQQTNLLFKLFSSFLFLLSQFFHGLLPSFIFPLVKTKKILPTDWVWKSDKILTMFWNLPRLLELQ